ncbi:MAG: tetratricopeptide repeat protein [Planctomycetes bacterium]|nr:tetratricopeptide repeat protein [Planctomycetota bacterium]
MPFSRSYRALDRFVLCVVALTAVAAGRATAQTSQPAASLIDPWPPFEVSLAEVKKQPLLLPADKTNLEGKPLTDAQRKEAEQAGKLLDESHQLRKKGDFAGALPKAREALRLRLAIYGSAHFHTITAIAAEKTLARYVASPPDELNDLAESDRAQLKAEAAYDKNEYANALSLATKALGIRERILGRGHHELGECYRIIGSAQTELSQMKEAELSLDRGVESTEKAYGKFHPVLARILDRQGWLYFNIGDLTRALSAHKTAVRIYSLTTGDTLDSAEACDNLGTVLAMRGDYDDALTSKIRALVVREAVAGPDSKDVGISYSNLAWLYTRLGVEAQVVPLRQKALAIFQKLLGPDHPYTTTETVNLGVNLQNLKRVEEAIALFKQAVDADEKRAAPIDAMVVGRITRLGTATFEAGRRDAADGILKSALAKAAEVKKLGNTRGAANEVRLIAEVYDAYRMYDSGIAALQEAAKWDDPALPDDSTVARGQMLGNMLVAVGRQTEGRDILKKTVDIANKLYGVGDRRTAAPLMALTIAYERSGDLAGAERTCDQVLKISESKFGAESKSNAIALRQMGRIYLLQKKIDLARFALDDCKKTVEKYQEFEQVEMVRTLHEYAELQVAEGNRGDAVKSLRDAYQRCKKLNEKTRTPHLDGLNAKTIKKLLDAIGNDAAPDKDALRSELRTILNRLKEGRSLDAENRQWLSELDGK